MNWLVYLMRILPLIPNVVAAIEKEHGDAKSGADKKQLAMESLGLASSVADAVTPETQATVDAATALASSTIDGVVSVMNTQK